MGAGRELLSSWYAANIIYCRAMRFCEVITLLLSPLSCAALSLALELCSSLSVVGSSGEEQCDASV